jgi:hypothetical protein
MTMNFSQNGGAINLNYYRGRNFQRGYGIGNLFGKFFRWIVPFVKTHALQVVKNTAKIIGHEV